MRLRSNWVPGAAVLTLALAAGQATGAAPLGPGGKYVAMGSSFAAGPGIGAPADTPPTRCARSADNYAHQLARKRGLTLVDVSCSGATTRDVLGPWNELPAQIEALTPDTALVTVTVGGNDVGFSTGLVLTSCDLEGAKVAEDVAKMCAAFRDFSRRSARGASDDEAAWKAVEAGLSGIAREVRRRSPKAKLVYVDYIRVVPTNDPCAAMPLPEAAAKRARAVEVRLAELTAQVARRSGAQVVKASELSADHKACDKVSWSSPFVVPPKSVPYHPDLAAMTAIADALDVALGR